MIDQEKIHNQCLSDDPEERIRALEHLGSNFSSLLDKDQAWNDLDRLTNDESNSVRSSAALALGSAFSHVPDKQQAWNDLHRLTNDENNYVRDSAAFAFGTAFSHVLDKQQAWIDLHRLTNDLKSNVRSSAAFALRSAFSHVPNKQQAWTDLHILTNDESNSVRDSAALTIGSAFSHVPDKQQAWKDLDRLTNDESNSVRSSAALALGSAFSHVSDNQQAWNDLHRLTNDENNYVRDSAAFAFGSAFSHVPDKQQAWIDLHRLTCDEYSNVRSSAASALGSAFSHIPDKQQALNDLHRLANDEDDRVRTSSNHSLGRISIFKASQAETDEDYKKELEKAIEFFEIAAKESFYYNSSKFCLPFYRSFHTIIFKKQEAKEEMSKFMEEAKAAIGGSKSKELLFEAVENLAKALKEVQNLENIDLETKKGELNFYREYCDHAAEIMKDTDEKAPFATEVLRKGFPILNRTIKTLIEEIQKDAKIICKESIGTDVAETACAVFKEVKKWEIGSQEEMTEKIDDLVYLLKTKIPNLPENEYILNKIEEIKRERDLTKQYETLLFVIGQIPTVKVVPIDIVVENNKVSAEKISKVCQGLGTKMDAHSQNLSKNSKTNGKKVRLKVIHQNQFQVKQLESKDPTMIPPRIFISYAREDFSCATRLYNDLKKAGTDPWLDKFSLLPGQRWESAIKMAIRESSFVIALISNRSITKRGFVNRELKYALNILDEFPEDAIYLIPARINDCKPSNEQLNSLHWVDLFPSYESGLQAIFKVVMVGFDKKIKKLLEEIQEKAKSACQVSQGTATQEIACAVSREVQKWEIGIQEEMDWQVESLISNLELTIPRIHKNQKFFDRINQIREERDIAKQYAIISSIIPWIPNLSMLDEIKQLQDSVDRLIASIDKLQNPHENLDKIQSNLEEIKKEIPEMKGRINEVLYELYSPLSTDQKLKIAIPIIPTLVSYEIETNVPKLAADKIDELKNLVLRFKKSQ